MKIITHNITIVDQEQNVATLYELEPCYLICQLLENQGARIKLNYDKKKYTLAVDES